MRATRGEARRTSMSSCPSSWSLNKNYKIATGILRLKFAIFNPCKYLNKDSKGVAKPFFNFRF